MQNQATEGRIRRLASRLKARKTPSPSTSPTSSRDNQASHAVKNDYNDRRRVQFRYEEAAKQLKEAIKIRNAASGSFDFEELSGEPEGFDDLQFEIRSMRYCYRGKHRSRIERVGPVYICC